jgi:hypothetical protein
MFTTRRIGFALEPSFSKACDVCVEDDAPAQSTVAKSTNAPIFV